MIVLGEHVSFPSNSYKFDWVWGQIIAYAISRVSMLSRALSYKMLTLLSLSTRILDTRQLLMCIVTIRVSLCKKCTTQASTSENKIGLFGNEGGLVSTIV